MTSIAEQARKAQAEHFEENGGDLGALREPTMALYESVDALDADTRSLLTVSALARISDGLRELVTEDSRSHRMALVQGLIAFVGIAGYATALNREQAGLTATGDSRVNDVFDKVRELVTASMAAHLPPEVESTVNAMMKRVTARIDNGEDPETALEAEYELFKDQIGEYVTHKGDPAPSAPAPKEDVPTPGMYL